MKEMQELREALEQDIEAKKGLGKATKMAIAALYVDLGPAAFGRIQNELRSMQQMPPGVVEVCRNEIAAVKAERERGALKGDFLDPESRPLPGKQLTKEEAEQLPVGSLVWCRENDGQVKCADGLWHWECQGRHYTCNMLRHDGPYVVIATQETSVTPKPQFQVGQHIASADVHNLPKGSLVRAVGSGYVVVSGPKDPYSPPCTTPQPGDRLTREQLASAPDGSIAVDQRCEQWTFTKRDGKWFYGSNIAIMGDEIALVRWGNPS